MDKYTPAYPLFLQKMCPAEAFRNCGLGFALLWRDRDRVLFDGQAVCLGGSLTPVGFDLARTLLVGHVSTMREKHDAAAWLSNAAAKSRQRLESAVADALVVLGPESGEIPAGLAERARQLACAPPGPTRRLALSTFQKEAGGVENSQPGWAPGLVRAALQ